MSGPFYAPGNYVCRVTQQGFGEAKSSGNPMILLGVEPKSRLVLAHDGAEDLEHCEHSYERTVRLVIASEEQKEYAMLKLRYAGFDGDSFSKLNLIDCEVRCVCKHQNGTGENSDKVYEQWDLMLPPRDRVAMQPLDNMAARKLDAMFGKRLKGSQKPVAASAASVSDSDDGPVPF